MTTRPWRCGLTLQAVLVAVVACSSIAFGQDSANLRDDTAERLLEALDERGMPDVSLWLLERLAQPDAGISAELRSELAYRKALALVGVGRTEPNAEKRRTTFEQAQQAIDAFLACPVPQPPLPQGADELDQVAEAFAVGIPGRSPLRSRANTLLRAELEAEGGGGRAQQQPFFSRGRHRMLCVQP